MNRQDAHTAELQRAITIRAQEIHHNISELRGITSIARVSLHRAFDLFNNFGVDVQELANQAVAHQHDNVAQRTILRTLLRHLLLVTEFVEKNLTHGRCRRELSQALSDEVNEELSALGLTDYNVILAQGDAANFVTQYGDFDQYINGPVRRSETNLKPDQRYFALFRVPQLEGRGVYWKPILVGHEVAHVYIAKEKIVEVFDLKSEFDFSSARDITSRVLQRNDTAPDNARALYGVATDWLRELICDFYTLHRYGPASVAALGEYFETIGSYDDISLSHPPSSLRIHLLLEGLGSVTSPRLRRVVAPWQDVASNLPTFAEDWIDFLVELFSRQLDALKQVAEDTPTSRYELGNRVEQLHDIADRLAVGIVSCEDVRNPDSYVEKRDIVNAAWLARSEGTDTEIDSLARKAIENVSFIAHWKSGGGELPALRSGQESEQTTAGGSVLSERALIDRILHEDDDKKLTITPLLHYPKGCAVDLRIGCRFIVFHRTRESSFDPLDKTTDARRIQSYHELAWTEQIVVHPHELLLGSTLEFLAMPPDLTGQVITRSSYGRLGLLSATAVQVHPNFQGCLTLELVNLSNLPLVLTPGERIAQLVIWRTDPISRNKEKYHCPVGPEFSKASRDIESKTLLTSTPNRS